MRYNMRCSVTDGWLYMVMLGLAETFFALFVLEVFDSPVASGLVLTVPLMLASVFQLASPQFTRMVGSYRALSSATAWLQAIACVPLAIIAFTGGAPLWVVFLVVTLYHCGAIVGGAPWSTMMSLLFPAHIRSRFFAKRNRRLQFGSILGVAIGAVLLEYADVWVPRSTHAAASLGITIPDFWLHRPHLPAFGVLFLLAALARSVSATLLGMHREPADAISSLQVLGARELIDRVRKGPGAALIAKLCTFQFAMMIGSPFWAAFVKDISHASFLQWASMIICWMLGRAIAVRWAGEVAAKWGRDRLMLIGALLMAPCPALWAISTNFVWLACAQLYCGMAIACWELCVWLSTVAAFSDEERTSMLSKFGLLQYSSGAAGSSLGGLLIRQFDSTRIAFTWAFLASTLARTLVLTWVAMSEYRPTKTSRTLRTEQ